MFNEHDTNEITTAVIFAVDNAMDLESHYAEVDEAMKGLGDLEFRQRDPVDSAISSLVAEAIEQAFWIGFKVGQRPAAIFGATVSFDTVDSEEI